MCFRARFVDANRCETRGGEVSWGVARSEGDATGTLDGACVEVPSQSATGALTVTATSGAMSDRAVLTVVPAERYQDLVATQVDIEDAGVAELEPPRPAVGAVSLAPQPPSSSRNGRIVWALGALAVALAAAGAWLLRRSRAQRRDVREAAPSLTTPSVPESSSVSTPAPSHDETAPTETTGTKAPSDAPPASHSRAPDAPSMPVVAMLPSVPVSAPPAAVEHTRVCPSCGTHHPASLAFCPHDGTALRDTHTSPAPVAPVVQSSGREGTCPRCGRRYPPHMMFCGEDGATLTHE